MKVFVYGTLKQGFGNHLCLQGASFVVPGFTTSRWVMADSGFPALLREGGTCHQVRGEVYEFENPKILERLDRLEGEGFLFRRVTETIEGDDDQTHECLMYEGIHANFAECSIFNPVQTEGKTYYEYPAARR